MNFAEAREILKPWLRDAPLPQEYGPYAIAKEIPAGHIVFLPFTTNKIWIEKYSRKPFVWGRLAPEVQQALDTYCAWLLGPSYFVDKP